MPDSHSGSRSNRSARRRRLARIALGVACGLALGGCQTLGGAGSTAPPNGRLQAILSRGELRVGLTADQPPLNMKTKSGEIQGLEIDLVEALASAMELRVVLVEMPFAELLPAVESGKVDLVISGVTITPERNARVAFVGPYFITGKSLVGREASFEDVTEISQVDDPARTYVTLAASTSEKFVRTFLPRAKLVTTPDYESAVALVIDGRADAMVGDVLACNVAAWRHPEAGLSTPRTPFTAEPLGIALPGDDPLLVNLVENYLDTLEDTGILTQLKAKWLSDGSWIQELP